MRVYVDYTSTVYEVIEAEYVDDRQIAIQTSKERLYIVLPANGKLTASQVIDELCDKGKIKLYSGEVYTRLIPRR